MEQLSIHILFEAMSTLVAASIFIVLLFDRKEGPVRLSFLAMTFSMVVWQVTKLATNASVIYDLDLNIEFLRKLSFWGISMVPPTTLLMASFLSHRFRGKVKYLVYLGFLLLLAFIALEPTGLLFNGHRLTQYGYFHNPGPLYLTWMGLYSLVICGGLYLLFPSHYQRFPDFQRQSFFIFAAAGFGFAIGALEFYSVMYTPIFPIADLAPCLFGGVLYWAIFRFNFLGGWGVFKVVFMRLLFFMAIYLVVYLVYNGGIWVQQATGLPNGNSIFVFCAALVTTLLMPLYLLIVKSIRRKFYPIRYGYRTIFLNLLQKLTQLQSLDKMVRTALDEMEKHFGYSEGYGILFDRNGLEIKHNQYKLIQAPIHLPRFKPNFFDRDLQRILNRYHVLQGLRFSRTTPKERVQYLNDFKFLQRLQADLIVPIHSNGVCYGLLVLKERHFKAESWLIAERLLDSISEILGGQIAQSALLEHQSQQERLSQVGMMAAGMAHEIKNPLEGIYGAAQLIEEEDEDNPMIKIVLKESRRLNDLVHQFLEFSRPFKLHFETTDMTHFLKEFVLDQSALGLELEFIQLPRESQAIHSLSIDPRALSQVLINLVQNAKRYQVPHQAPQLVWIPHRNRIEVRDQGPGVPLEDQERIFTPFYTTSNKGTGLGLAISQKIAREMGGDLFYESPETGSHFIIELGRK